MAEPRLDRDESDLEAVELAGGERDLALAVRSVRLATPFATPFGWNPCDCVDELDDGDRVVPGRG